MQFGNSNVRAKREKLTQYLHQSAKILDKTCNKMIFNSTTNMAERWGKFYVLIAIKLYSAGQRD
jgi:hypothetical protein